MFDTRTTFNARRTHNKYETIVLALVRECRCAQQHRNVTFVAPIIASMQASRRTTEANTIKSFWPMNILGVTKKQRYVHTVCTVHRW